MPLSEHLEKLRHFYKVTQFRSINEASKVMGMSQAGLSKSLANLESVVGARLLLRSREGLLLTIEGERVLKSTTKILEEAASLEASLRSLKVASTPSVLRIGMYDSIAVYFFQAFSNYTKKIYPNLNLTLFVGTSEKLATSIRESSIDLAVGVNLRKKKPLGSEFFLLFEDHYSFYISPKLESEAAGLPLIIYPNVCDIEGVPLEELLQSRLRKNEVHRVFNFETLKMLTIQGHGIGVLPTQVARPMIESKQLKQIQLFRTKQLFGKHEIGFLATANFLLRHREFAMDIYRLGKHWVAF